MKEGEPRFNRRTFLKGLAWFTSGIVAEGEAMEFGRRSYQNRHAIEATQKEKETEVYTPCLNEPASSIQDNDEIAMNVMIGVAVTGVIVGVSRMWDSRKIKNY